MRWYAGRHGGSLKRLPIQLVTLSIPHGPKGKSAPTPDASQTLFPLFSPASGGGRGGSSSGGVSPPSVSLSLRSFRPAPEGHPYGAAGAGASRPAVSPDLMLSCVPLSFFPALRFSVSYKSRYSGNVSSGMPPLSDAEKSDLRCAVSVHGRDWHALAAAGVCGGRSAEALRKASHWENG